MTQVAQEELNRLSSDIEECNVIYLPQVREMTPVFILFVLGHDYGDVHNHRDQVH